MALPFTSPVHFDLPAFLLTCSVLKVQPSSVFSVAYDEAAQPAFTHSLIVTLPLRKTITSSNGLSPFFVVASSGITLTVQVEPSRGPEGAVWLAAPRAETGTMIAT